VIKWGLDLGVDPTGFAAIRFALTAALMAALLPWLMRGTRLWVRPTWPVVLLGCLNGGAFLMQYLAQARTTSVHASLVIGAGLPITAFVSAFVLKEAVGWLKLGAVALAMGGVFLVVTEGDLARLVGGALAGDLLAFGAALCWTVYLVVFKWHYNESRQLVAVTFWVFAITALITVAAAPLLGTPSLDLSPAAWGVVIYTAVFCSIVPFLLFSYALQHITATVSSILLMTETIAAVLLSMAAFGENLTWLGWLGAGLILAASGIVSRD
jgi:drug/metabolite transporter (DMT)-like permease